MAERLLRAGANVDAENRFGETPLSNECMSLGTTIHYDAVEVLLKHRADPTVKDNEGQLDLAFNNVKPKDWYFDLD